MVMGMLQRRKKVIEGDFRLLQYTAKL